MSSSLVLIGAGRMGGAMARGWLAHPSGPAAGGVSIVEPAPSGDLIETAEAGRLLLNPKPQPSSFVVLAVKPQGFSAACVDIARWVGPGSVVISIMAGVPMERISTALGVSRVARAMPNTPGAIGKGVTGYCRSEAVGAEHQAAIEALLAPLGEVVGPLDENLIDVVTAISGSGPAYVFLLAETLAAAGMRNGLDESTARVLARATVSGAGALLESGEDPAALLRAVTSPGGTTAAALSILMGGGGLEALMEAAVSAAIARSRELASS